MAKTILILMLIVSTSWITLYAADVGVKINITSLDVESGMNIPLSSAAQTLDYSSGGLVQMNFQINEDDRLAFSFSTGYGSYDSTNSNIIGLYNFTALLGMGYNIALGDNPVTITPSIYGGFLGQILKSDTDSLENIFDNLYANQIFGADLEVVYMPETSGTKSSLGIFLAGSVYLYPNHDNLSVHSSAKAGIRYYFR